jgi:hypothetical protein
VGAAGACVLICLYGCGRAWGWVGVRVVCVLEGGGVGVVVDGAGLVRADGVS